MTRPGEWADTAGAVQRLAVLLEAGIAPTAAFRAVAATRPEDPILTRAAEAPDAWQLARALAAVADSAETQRRGWAPVVAAWQVAAEAGAPLGPTLSRLAEVLRGLAQSARAIESALAGPVASARILVLLPLVGVLFGVALGFDTARVLFTTPAGWACLAGGTVLLVLGALWSRRMLRRARRHHPAPGLGSELLAVALAGGLPPDRALASTGSALAEAGLPRELESAVATLDFARSAGVPAGALLRAEAEEERRSAAAEA